MSLKLWIKKIFDFFRAQAVWLIFLFSFLLPLGYSFYYHIAPVVDAQAYDQIAVNLADSHTYKEDLSASYQFDASIIRAGPAYEFFLAAIYKIFGHHYEIVWVWQAVLHAFSAFLLYLIAREMFGEDGDVVGLLAALLFGFHPDLIEISAMLMTETFYLFFIILALWLFARLYHHPNQYRYTISLSFVLGLAVLSRPPVLLFVPVILVYYFLNKNYRSATLFLLTGVLTLAPWAIRNFIIYHQLILTSMIGEYNLWVGNTLRANGGQISDGFNPLTTYTGVHGFFALKQKASQEFWSFIFSYPGVFIKLCLIRTMRFFSLIRPMGFWFYQTGWRQLVFIATSAVAGLVMFVGGFSGMVFAFKQQKALWRYFVVLALTAPLALLPTVVESRYRFQLYPFLALFGGYFLLVLVRKSYLVREKIKILSLVSCVLFGVSLIDLTMFWGLIKDRISLFF